jgi:DNA polymerase-3 subunit delta'
MGLVEATLRERLATEPERARLLAHLSGGRIGWAMAARDDQRVLEQRRERIDELLAVIDAGRMERLDYANRLSQQGDRLKDVLELWLGWWRDLLLVKGGCAERVTNIDQVEALTGRAAGYRFDDIERFVRAIQRTLSQLDQNVNARLALEVLLLNLPRAAGTGEG